MALTVYLCGHGAWQPNNGFFTLPKGVSAEMQAFYRDAGRNPTQDILVLAPNDFAGRLVGPRNDTYYLRRFFEDEADFVRNASRQYGRVDFVWACCMQLALTPSRFGAEIGVNAGEWEDRFHRLDLTQPHGHPVPIGRAMPK